MKKKIVEHQALNLHTEAVGQLKARHEQSLTRLFENLREEERKLIVQKNIATVRMVRTVYAEVILNIPLDSHADITILQKLNGADLGLHHYERRSATSMLDSISQLMHTTLLNHLTSNTYPMSILLDTSTDASQRNFLIIFLRTLEHNHPQTYFYRCIHISSESAEQLMDVLTASFTRDKLDMTMKSRLVAFASDGASTMVGSRTGLATRVNSFTQSELFRIHCFAHKLQLGIGHAFQTIPVLKTDFEGLINGIYNFYNRHSVKRKASLQNTASALGEQLFELNYIHEIRWISSELSALDRLNKSIFAIFSNLEEISASPEFDKETQDKAVGFLKRLTNIRFYSTMLFMMDLLQALAYHSKHLQLTSGIIIGSEQRRTELLSSIDHFRTDNGPALTFFLLKAKCFKDVNWKANCLASDLDKTQFMFGGMIFTQPDIRHSRYPDLMVLRQDLVESLKSELNSYFPEGSLAMFEVLNPNELPTSDGSVYTFAPRIMPLAQRFNIDMHAVSAQFADLLRSMILDHESYCAYRTKGDPLAFWSHFLSVNTLPWAAEIKNLIQIVLVLPVSTADAERGFSILKHARYDRRSRLSAEHIEDILRLRVNGPGDIQHFDAERYAAHWLQNHQDTADPQGIRNTADNIAQRSGSTLF